MVINKVMPLQAITHKRTNVASGRHLRAALAPHGKADTKQGARIARGPPAFVGRSAALRALG